MGSSFHRADSRSDDDTELASPKDYYSSGLAFGEEKMTKLNDYLNVSRRFNRKNLQQCQKKNK